MHRCAFFPGDGLKDGERAEMRGRQDHCGAVRYTSQIAKHHGEAMVERYGNAKAIPGGEVQQDAGDFLARARALVADAGGKLAVLSAPGAGTRVEVQLPLLTGGQL